MSRFSEQNEQIVAALKGRRIMDVDAPYGGTVGVDLNLDDGTTVSFEPETEWQNGVLRVEVDGKAVTR